MKERTRTLSAFGQTKKVMIGQFLDRESRWHEPEAFWSGLTGQVFSREGENLPFFLLPVRLPDARP